MYLQYGIVKHFGRPPSPSLYLMGGHQACSQPPNFGFNKLHPLAHPSITAVFKVGFVSDLADSTPSLEEPPFSLRLAEELQNSWRLILLPLRHGQTALIIRPQRELWNMYYLLGVCCHNLGGSVEPLEPPMSTVLENDPEDDLGV